MKGHSPGRRKGVIRMKRFTCMQCGKAVERVSAGKAKFCSLSCSGTYTQACRTTTGKVSVTCAGCGQAFEKWKAWLRGAAPDEKLHFHDRACRRHYFAAQRLAKERRIEQLIEHEGLSLTAARYRTSNGRSRVSKACATCGREFLVAGAAVQSALYCSLACKDVGQSRLMTGRRNVPAWKSSAYRGMVRRLFVDRCVICGWDEARNDVCHIVARKDGGEDSLENIVMLCPNHHRLLDTGKLPKDVVLAAKAQAEAAHSAPASNSSA